MAKTKKIDVKKIAKLKISELIAKALTEAGYTVHTDNENYNFTAGTLVVEDEVTDVQVKFIAPKPGETRYDKIEDEEEDEEGLTEDELEADKNAAEAVITEPMSVSEVINLD